VHSGRFAVRIGTRFGDTVMLNMIGPSETFGEIALLDDSAPRSVTIVAVEAGETRAIHKVDFDAQGRGELELRRGRITVLDGERLAARAG
jgi:CRP-like cAMP-binding protein